MTRFQSHSGFTLIDTLISVAILAIMAGMALPMVDSSTRGFAMRGDAQGVANMVSLAKMRAASRFTRTRIRADLNAGTYQLESWDKVAGAWALDGGVVLLSRGVQFGFGALLAAPPNTQAAIGQSPNCTGPNSLVADFVANTACIVFNSRGVPVDPAGAPLGGNALYITDNTAVYATTVTATPLVRQWWSNNVVAAWLRR
jgi:type II secretory pathway pseudopilin PulG